MDTITALVITAVVLAAIMLLSMIVMYLQHRHQKMQSQTISHSSHHVE